MSFHDAYFEWWDGLTRFQRKVYSSDRLMRWFGWTVPPPPARQKSSDPFEARVAGLPYTVGFDFGFAEPQQSVCGHIMAPSFSPMDLPVTERPPGDPAREMSDFERKVDTWSRKFLSQPVFSHIEVTPQTQFSFIEEVNDSVKWSDDTVDPAQFVVWLRISEPVVSDTDHAEPSTDDTLVHAWTSESGTTLSEFIAEVIA